MQVPHLWDETNREKYIIMRTALQDSEKDTTPSQNTAGSVYIFARFFFDAKTTHSGVIATCSAILDVTTAR